MGTLLNKLNKSAGIGWYLCDICGRPYNYTTSKVLIHRINPNKVDTEYLTTVYDMCPICEERLIGWIEGEKKIVGDERKARDIIFGGIKEDEMVTIDMLKTGDRINELRIAQGLTVSDIQKAMGFNTPAAIYKWLHGVTLPTLDNLVILAEVFDVSINDILVVNKGGKS